MRYVQFVVLREGPSDDALLSPIRTLLIECGADEAVGEVRDYGGTVAEKLAAVAQDGVPYEAIFVHRDADSAGHDAREAEIRAAAGEVAPGVRVIPVIPVRMTEAWALTNELEIRRVAGNPGGRTMLGLPPLRAIEQAADPKEILREALCVASELTGRRLADFKKQFSRQRRSLLERLEPGGAIEGLESWARLRAEVNALVSFR